MAITTIPSSGTTDGTNLVKLHSTTLSSAAATVSIDGFFTSDYDVYKIFVYNYENETDAKAAFWRVNVGGTAQSSGIYTSAGTYGRVNTSGTTGDGPIGNYNSYNQQYFSWVSGHNVGTNFSKMTSEMIIFNPLQTHSFKDIHYKIAYEGNSNVLYNENFTCKVQTTSALSGFTFLPDSGGNIETGTFTLYGVRT